MERDDISYQITKVARQEYSIVRQDKGWFLGTC